MIDQSKAPQRRGRPPIPQDEAHIERFALRLTKAQREKLDKLGGSEWLRDRIDRAKLK